MAHNLILCVERKTAVKFCERYLGQFFFHPFFLIHLASVKECMHVACVVVKCQTQNQPLVPGKPQQVSEEKEKSEFNCKAELHRRAADLLSVKCTNVIKMVHSE